jgi:signal transduction histidine kinase
MILDPIKLSHTFPRTIQAGVIALFVLCAAVIGRTLVLAYTELPDFFPQYLGATLFFLILFVLVMWRQGISSGLLHTYFIVQSILVVYLMFLPPHLDFIDVLFVLLSYQVALVFTGRSLWIWCSIFIALTLGILIYYLGVWFGIAYSMTPIAGCVIFPVYVIATREQELARRQSQKILNELQEKHSQLEIHANQVEQIAAIEERNRLARELHDSVSQTIFSIILNTGATQIAVDRDPSSIRGRLVKLQVLALDALEEMRKLIAQLRPLG